MSERETPFMDLGEKLVNERRRESESPDSAGYQTCPDCKGKGVLIWGRGLFDGGPCLRCNLSGKVKAKDNNENRSEK